MTDNEIIKALECCACMNGNYCKLCPLHPETSAKCFLVLMENTLNLINRQDAEIEMLRAMLITQTEYAQDLEKALREAKGGE